MRGGALKEQTETPAPPCRRRQKTHPSPTALHPTEEWREERLRRKNAHTQGGGEDRSDDSRGEKTSLAYTG